MSKGNVTPVNQSDWRRVYKHRYYQSNPSWQTPYERWCELISRYVPAKSTILEIGGGPTLDLTRRLRPMADRLFGLDIDPIIKNNTLLDHSIVYGGDKFTGIDDDVIDVAVADWVNEHIANPGKHFREVNRVLKPGGLYISRTVNLYHYKALAARCTPRRLQTPFVRWLRHTSFEDYDPYEVYYRANTRRRIEHLSKKAGLIVRSYETIESIPAYGWGARPLFFLFMGYERFVNSSPQFECLRHTIQCVLQKGTTTQQ